MSGKTGRMRIYNKRMRPERGKRRGWKEKRTKEEKGGEEGRDGGEGRGESATYRTDEGEENRVKPEGGEEKKEEKNRRECPL